MLRKLFTHGLVIAAIFTVSAAQAGYAVYSINATVTDVYDPGNVLQGRMALGTPITGTYQFDTTAPDEDPSMEWANYNQANRGAVGFDLIAGTVSLKTDPSVPGHMHYIHISNFDSDFFHIGSWGNTPLYDGVKIDDINFDLYDMTGTALNSTSLSATAPNIYAFEQRSIYISGTDASGFNYFSVVANLDSLTGDTSVGPAPNPRLVTLQLEAVIRDVWDPSGALEGKLLAGQSISGTYSYDKTLADRDPTPDYGFFEHSPDGSGYGFNIDAGGFNFRTNSQSVPMTVNLYNGNPNDTYMVYGWGQNFPLPNGTTVEDIGMYLHDDTGLMLSSDQIKDNPPSISGGGFYDIYFSGTAPNGDWYSVVAAVTVLKPAEQSKVSPADGYFIPGQQFDAAVILKPDLAPIVDFHATLSTSNGMFMDLPRCFTLPPNSKGHQVLMCPGYSQFLMSEVNTVEFNILLLDGSHIQKRVIWNLLY